MGSFVPYFSSSSFFLFSRMSPSLSLYITPPLMSFLPPWVHPWKASLMGLMLCLGPQLPAEAHIPSAKLVPRDESNHTKRVSEATPIPAETLTPQEGVIPSATA